ncbi:hypothetical protein, partial [Vibrio mediterranei]|uniref:hypothetical protein n=1 Tax=Vibrio mediterranei TaxID=689 RepID=UPI001C635663
IGLSIEEPAFNRTTTWKALVAAKAWVSHYPKLVKWIGKLSIQAFKSDSQRLAFLIPSLGFVFTVVWLGFVVALLTYMVSPCFASQ